MRNRIVWLFSLVILFTALGGSANSQDFFDGDISKTKILFFSSRDGNRELYIMDHDGSNQTRITNNSWDDDQPKWSPDNEWIAFRSWAGGNSDIYIMDKFYENLTRLTTDSAEDLCPSWSPDGSRIAFTSDRSGNWEVYTIHIKSGLIKNLSNHSSLDYEPAWSPDPNKLAFTSDRDGDWEIYTMDTTGVILDTLTENNDRDRLASWSPDGSEIAYTWRGAGTDEVFLMLSNGDNIKNLTNHGSTDGTTCFSPDGQKIAFNSSRTGWYDIYVMDKNGSNVDLLAGTSQLEGHPDWSNFIPGMILPGYTIQCGNTQINGGRGTIVFTVSNPGSGNLVIEDINISDPVFSVNPVSAVIPPGDNHVFTLEFNPAEIGEYKAIMVFSSNLPGSNPDTLNVKGHGVLVINDGHGDYYLVPAGEFQMGDNFFEGELDERPVHTVDLDSFYIGKFEVTNTEYKKFIDEGGYSIESYWNTGGFGEYGSEPKYWYSEEWKGGGLPGNTDYPVVGVSWYEAMAYCTWLSVKTGRTYRLPTEAEWEKAARDTDQRRYPWGNEFAGNYSNYWNSGDPHDNDLTPVGYFDGNIKDGYQTGNNASPYGAYDMAGNVWEWCLDWYSSTYYQGSYDIGTVKNPEGPLTGSDKLIRGGARGNQAQNIRSAERAVQAPDFQSNDRGFRCVIELEKQPDRSALEALYYSLNGQNWTNNENWLTGSDISTWYGVSLNGDGRVSELNLTFNNLTGTIPPEIGMLTELETLDFGSNVITGSIPSEIGGLSELRLLFLHENKLTGEIPESLWELTSLQYLYLGPNQLTGSISPLIGNLTELQNIILSNNEFSGPFPEEIGNLASLLGLQIQFNQFTGAFPETIAILSNLEALLIHDNQFEDLADLSSMPKLDQIWAANNRFDFGDLEPNINVNEFRYIPQAEVGDPQFIEVDLHGDDSLYVETGGTANVYKWMKDGVILQESTDPVYRITSAAYIDSGNYSLEIRNSIVDGLVLSSKPIVVNVKAPVVKIRLINSSGEGLSGGAVQFYDGGWLSVDTTDTSGYCTFSYDGNKTELSVKMTYAGFTMQMSNQDISNDIVFETLPVRVSLFSSDTTGLEGSVRYYAAGWNEFGSTDSTGFTPVRELLPGKYSFKMTFAGFTEQKSNIDISKTNPVEFNTVPFVVRLESSNLEGLAEGSVQFYAAGWNEFGSTDSTGFTPVRELLPGKYSFKMTYKGFTQQIPNIDISQENPLVYSTVAMRVGLHSSHSSPLPEGSVQFYAAGWNPLGTTQNDGYTNPVELLPGNYSFRMTYAGKTEQKSNIDINIENPLEYQTVGSDIGDCVSGTLNDYDNNIYRTVKIGSQWWMKENLKVTHYSNGDTIPKVKNDSEWGALAEGAYSYYNDSTINRNTYGNLYNWHTISDDRKISPFGWNIPTDEEWKNLEIYLGMGSSTADMTSWRGTNEGGNLKEAGNEHWKYPNYPAENSSGFTALPSGFRGSSGAYVSKGEYTYFWSSSEYSGSHAWYRSLSFNKSQIRRDAGHIQDGYSIRCVKDVADGNFVVKLLDSSGKGLQGGKAEYYASGWKFFGITDENGIAAGIELLPGTYSFKITYAGKTEQKSNVNISIENPVIFRTVSIIPHEDLSYTNIVFSSDRDGDYEIYLLDPENDTTIKVTDNNSCDLDPDLSPDGSRIVFHSDMDGDNEIYIVNADGKEDPIQLTFNSVKDQRPVWSPDGKKIAYQSMINGNNDIYIMDVEKRITSRITTDPACDYGPTWSPDGKRIAFASKRDGNYNIYKIDTLGNNLKRLTKHPESEEFPSWSPDGKSIAYVSTVHRNYDVFVMDSSGAEAYNKQLTTSPSYDYAPEWIPDGSLIFFSSNRSGDYDFYSVKPDGTDEALYLLLPDDNELFPSLTRKDNSPVFTVRLLDSNGNGLSGGIVKYYASGWKEFGVTDESGIAAGIELLPGTYSFKMSYEGYTQQKSNIDITENIPVEFTTLPMRLQLVSSDSTGLSGGISKYYASGWKDFGETDTTGLTPVKELLPGKYSFKMNHAGFTQMMSNISISETNPLIYQTEPIIVSLISSDSTGLEGGVVSYYASGWRSFGETGPDGFTDVFEMLPGKYSFKLNYKGFTQQKSNILISENNPLVYQTIPMEIALYSPDSSGISDGIVKYYASGWKEFGVTDTTGYTLPVELLPGKYSFKMCYDSKVFQKSNIHITDINPLYYILDNGILSKNSSMTELAAVSINKFELFDNYPNPFNPETNIKFTLPKGAEVKLEIYNMTGQLVRTLVSGNLPAGYHRFRWDGTNNAGTKAASGMYIYRIKAAGFSAAKRMLLIK